MPALWTITYNGVEKSAADWGLNAQPVIRTRDRMETVFSFRMAGADPSGVIPFNFKDQVIIRQNRTVSGGTWSGSGYVFTGYLMNPKGRLDKDRQGVMLDFADAIWLMKNTVFQQLWNLTASDGHGGVVVTPQPISRCVLFMDINSYLTQPWAVKSVQWQVNEIIAYAQSCGVAIAPGTIDYSGFYINYTHVRAISCWDAILKCLEPVPDAKVWVDGSQNPPILNVRTRANLAALAAPTTTGPGPITLPWRGKDALGRSHLTPWELTPRYDLVPSQVVIQYQLNNTVNGKAAPSFQNDVYPPGSNGKAPFAMVVPIDLTGVTATTTTGTLDCEPLLVTSAQTGYTSGSAPDHAAKRAWWASKRGGENGKLAQWLVRFGANTLADATVTDDGGNPINLAQYPNRIVKGTYHSWMNNGGASITAIRAKVSVQAQFTQYDKPAATPAETDTNGNKILPNRTETLECHITLTNAPAGVSAYTLENVSQSAEVPATGLAQNIFNSRRMLDYDGSHLVIDPGDATHIPLTQIIGPWNLINFSGGNPAWANANMTVAGTEIDLIHNTQRIDIGPNKHLSPQDFNTLLQFFRQRLVLMFAGQRATGYADQNAAVDMARNTPDANSVPGLQQDQAMTFLAPDANSSGLVNLLQHDATTGQISRVQQDNTTTPPTNLITGVIGTMYNGAGAPGPGTLA